MQPSDLFPIERCSRRLKKAILAEFNGRCPAFQEILSISQRKWLRVPGIGQTLLVELDSIIQGQNGGTEGYTFKDPNDAELVARLKRLQRDLNRLQHDIQALIGRATLSQTSSDGSDLH